MKINCIFKIFVMLLFLFNFNYLHALPKEGCWTEEIYIDNNEIPYSIFSIELKIDDNDKVNGEVCSIIQYGNKNDCPILFSSTLIDNKIKVHFDSTFGGVNGLAVIIIQGNNLSWDLIHAPEGEYYLVKKALLLPEKN
ncbi:hypothetical protein [Gilliamella apicola]|uniref:hypothetical protein n=1 Tax=Gilliamella apicola TaxID=1196095 RepID=UPI002FEDF9D5